MGAKSAKELKGGWSGFNGDRVQLSFNGSDDLVSMVVRGFWFSVGLDFGGGCCLKFAKLWVVFELGWFGCPYQRGLLGLGLDEGIEMGLDGC